MVLSARSARVKAGRKGVGVKGVVQKIVWVCFVLFLLVIFSLVFVVPNYVVSDHEEPVQSVDGVADGFVKEAFPRAVLIDALYASSPNEVFSESFVRILGDAGFETDVFRGANVTVKFLKSFSGDYELVVLRMHSALSMTNELFLFTAEPYSEFEYEAEQRFGLVKKAYAVDSDEPVFAVNWGFVKRCMSGKFNRTLVVLMGCDGASDLWLFQEFVNQGALGCVGWDGSVLLSHSDKAIIGFVEALYLQKLSLKEAVDEANMRFGEDPVWNAVLEGYVP